MERISMDKDWLFYKGEPDDNIKRTHTYFYMAAKAGGATGAAAPDFATDSWQLVNLPHDWAVYGDFDPSAGPAQGYKPRGKGWYQKRFRLGSEDEGKQLLIEFEGVSGHCEVYCNGSIVARNFCGYTTFTADITDMAVYGDGVNTVTVHVDADVIEGWWYEGAGIYRHVNLYKRAPLHIKHRGIFVHPEKKSADVWDALTDTVIENIGYKGLDYTLLTAILDEKDNVVGKSVVEGVCGGCAESEEHQSLLTYSPKLWDIDSPNMYRLVSRLYDKDKNIIDEAETPFGFRTIEISADNGFMLNGRRVQLYGTCNHQDHAGVGVAVSDSINEYRIKLLKEMGSNAYRCSHGNPSPVILDLCDKYGILVMDENRNFSTSPDGIAQVESMVIRDRNHPSVVMYSIFNEEPLQGTPTGRKLAEHLNSVIGKLDNTRFTVGAMNTGVLEEKGAANVLDMTGFNYITHTYDDFRRKFPDMPMIGSENDSAFQTRGVYKTDHSKHIIDCYDSEAAAWGNTYRDGFRQIDSRPHIMGMFIWTGFDYRGEPTPFEYPSISTQFGIMDTCGFKKDAFYLNKAFFTSEPMMHVLPHWNWNEGETVKVMVHTNCPEAEIFVNGESQGRKAVDKYEMAQWSVPFSAGELKAVGYTENGGQATDTVLTAGEPARINIELSSDTVKGGCMDTVCVNVSVSDKNGVVCPTADNLIRFRVENGAVAGVGNGDPNSHEADKADFRRLFNGYAQCIAEASDGDYLTVTAESDGLESASARIPIIPGGEKFIESVKEKYINTWRMRVDISDKKPDINEKISDSDMNTWGIYTLGEDSRFDGACGFAEYRADIEADGGRLVFREIFGDYVYIYVNGEEKFSGRCDWGRRVEIALDGYSGTVGAAVVIESSEPSHRVGLSKSVIIEK